MWLSGGACPGLVREALNIITSIIITKMQRGAEKTMQRWRQRVEGRSHKPRGADSRQPQRLGETRVGAHREPLQGPWPPGSTLTLDSWPPELWAIYIYTHIHIHIHTHTYTDTHIYIYVYVCICKPTSWWQVAWQPQETDVWDLLASLLQPHSSSLTSNCQNEELRTRYSRLSPGQHQTRDQP